jgi:sec-independent protein translocase protein TatB
VFGIDSTELLVVAVAALVFIGPKELPGALRTLGRWIGTVRSHARHLTGGFEELMREAEHVEIEARWGRQASPAEKPDERSEPSSPPVAVVHRRPE